MGFSKRLKELREKKGLSQDKLAEMLNIPRSSITHYENSDDRLPRMQRLQKIADFFGVDVDYLIGRANTSELNKAEENFLNDIDKIPLEELVSKHLLTVNGKTATKEEIEGAIAFIRSLRGLK